MPFLTLLTFLLACGSVVAAPADAPKDRVVDPKKPDQSVLMDPRDARKAEKLEDILGEMESAEAKVETGQMKQEEFAKFVEAAVQKTEASVQESPGSPAVLLSASRVMSQAGRYDQAIAYADQAAALAPRDPWPVVNKGIAQFEKCDFPAAAGTARQALQRDPTNQNAVALWNLSQRPAGCGNVTDRLQSRFLGGKMRELAMPGRAPSLDFLRGPGLGDGRSPDAGRSAVSAADTPENRFTRENFLRFKAIMDAAGNALAAGDNRRTFDLATTAILAAPRNENPGALFLRAIAGMNLNRTESVIADASWGAKLDPKNKTKWLAMRASAENAVGRYAAALADAREAVRLDPTNPGAWSALGRAAQNLNHPTEEWLGAFKRASELSAQFTPLYEEALAGAESQRRAQSASQRGDLILGLSLSSDRAMLLLLGAGAAVLVGGLALVLVRRRNRDDA